VLTLLPLVLEDHWEVAQFFLVKASGRCGKFYLEKGLDAAGKGKAKANPSVTHGNGHVEASVRVRGVTTARERLIPLVRDDRSN
jgi:hypothetical protein